MSGLRVSDFDFTLPPGLIAQHPLVERGASRMLAMDRATGALTDSSFLQLPSLLRPGDVLVLNDSRVIPARLFARRANLRQRQASTGLIEVLLTGQTAPREWRALVKPGRKVDVGDTLAFSSPLGAVELTAEVLDHGEFGERLLRFAPSSDFYAALDRIGHVPLPPYIHREDQDSDRGRYQTVFSRAPGSVAAPTAGLHFTPAILASLDAGGVEVVRITLHVGLGTFAPLRVENVSDVHLHSERYTLPESTAAALNRARQESRRIVAVGTTVVRTLEHCALAAKGAALEPHSGTTQIFISPGFRFELVSALLTNFHLPQSSLLMLVSAFAGREPVLAAYAHAVRQHYRFFSYGDCMFLA